MPLISSTSCGPVVAAAAAALHRLDLVETGFPEAQHMLRQIEIFCDLADGAESVGALVHGRILTGMDRCARSAVQHASPPNCRPFSAVLKQYSSLASKPGAFLRASF